MNPEKINIGVHNAESLLFFDPKPWGSIPDLRRFRDQWALSRMSPHLRPTGRLAVIEFLEAALPRHERALSAHFGVEVTIDKARHETVRNESFDINEHPPMDSTWEYSGFGTHREGDTIKITFWR